MLPLLFMLERRQQCWWVITFNDTIKQKLKMEWSVTKIYTPTTAQTRVCLTLSCLTEVWPEFPNQACLVLQLWMETSDLAAQSLVCLLHALLPTGGQNMSFKTLQSFCFSEIQVSDWLTAAGVTIKYYTILTVILLYGLRLCWHV